MNLKKHINFAFLFGLVLTSAMVFSPVPIASENAREDWNEKFETALKLARDGEGKQALALVEEVLKSHPSHLPSLLLKGQILEDSGDLRGALQNYGKALVLFPRQPDLLIKMGILQLQQQNAPEAAELLRESLRVRPRYAPAMRYLAQACHQQGKDTLAIGMIKECISLNPRNGEACQKYGESLCHTGQYQEGLSWLLKARQLNPKLPRIDMEIGRAYYSLMDIPNSVFYLEKAVRLEAEDPWILSTLAGNYCRLSRWEAGLVCYRRLLRLKKENASVLLGAGRRLMELKNFQDAVEPLKQAIDLDPTLMAAHFYLSRVYLGLGKKVEAAHESQLHNQFMDRLSFPSSPNPMNPLWPTWEQSRRLLQQGREEEALAVFQEALRKVSASPASPFVYLGALCQSMDRPEEARRHLNRALAMDPKVPGFHLYLGIDELQREQLDSAEKSFSSELALNPTNLMARAELGQVRYRQGRWAEAVELLEQSKTAVPQFLYLLCDAYFHLGQIAQARLMAEALEAYARENPGVLKSMIGLLRRNQQNDLAEQIARRLAP